MKKLQLKKELVASLHKDKMEDLKGGGRIINNGSKVDFSGGCTDGCGMLRSLWNCTKDACSNDCPKSSQQQYCQISHPCKI